MSPYQPEGLWSVNSSTYTQSTGEDLYRRSLYTIWKRSVPHPTQGTFDAPPQAQIAPASLPKIIQADYAIPSTAESNQPLPHSTAPNYWE